VKKVEPCCRKRRDNHQNEIFSKLTFSDPPIAFTM
jgi:hypothetical protein